MSHRAPLYEQVEADLSQQIVAGQLPPDSPLMSEGELCSHYKVSRVTVRRAIDELVRKRLLYRRRGIGTFVGDPHHQLKTVSLTGYVDDVLPQNSLELLSSDLRPLPDCIAALLPAPVLEPCRRFLAVNHIDGQPFSFASFYFGPQTSPFIAAEDFRRAEPPIRLVVSRSGRRLVRAAQRVFPDVARGEAARHLQLRPGTPVLRIARVYLGLGDVPLQFVEAVYHPERYVVDVELMPRLDGGLLSALSPRPPRAAAERRPGESSLVKGDAGDRDRRA